jgi:hypothetical protein
MRIRYPMDEERDTAESRYILKVLIVLMIVTGMIILVTVMISHGVTGD